MLGQWALGRWVLGLLGWDRGAVMLEGRSQERDPDMWGACFFVCEVGVWTPLCHPLRTAVGAHVWG